MSVRAQRIFFGVATSIVLVTSFLDVFTNLENQAEEYGWLYWKCIILYVAATGAVVFIAGFGLFSANKYIWAGACLLFSAIIYSIGLIIGIAREGLKPDAWGWHAFWTVTALGCSIAVLRKRQLPSGLHLFGGLAALLLWAVIEFNWAVTREDPSFPRLTAALSCVFALAFFLLSHYDLRRCASTPENRPCPVIWLLLLLILPVLFVLPLLVLLGGLSFWPQILLSALALGGSLILLRLLRRPPESPVTGFLAETVAQDLSLVASSILMGGAWAIALWSLAEIPAVRHRDILGIQYPMVRGLHIVLLLSLVVWSTLHLAVSRAVIWQSFRWRAFCRVFGAVDILCVIVALLMVTGSQPEKTQVNLEFLGAPFFAIALSPFVIGVFYPPNPKLAGGLLALLVLTCVLRISFWTVVFFALTRHRASRSGDIPGAIEFRCECGISLRVARKHVGAKSKCPRCHRVLLIPFE